MTSHTIIFAHHLPLAERLKQKIRENHQHHLSQGEPAFIVESFQRLALMEPWERCRDHIPFQLDGDELHDFKELYRQTKEVSLGDLYAREYLDDKFRKKYISNQKGSNSIPKIQLAGLSIKEKVDKVYEAYSEGVVTIEEATSYFQLISVESKIMGSNFVAINDDVSGPKLFEVYLNEHKSAS